MLNYTMNDESEAPNCKRLNLRIIAKHSIPTSKPPPLIQTPSITQPPSPTRSPQPAFANSSSVSRKGTVVRSVPPFKVSPVLGLSQHRLKKLAEINEKGPVQNKGPNVVLDAQTPERISLGWEEIKDGKAESKASPKLAVSISEAMMPEFDHKRQENVKKTVCQDSLDPRTGTSKKDAGDKKGTVTPGISGTTMTSTLHLAPSGSFRVLTKDDIGRRGSIFKMKSGQSPGFIRPKKCSMEFGSTANNSPVSRSRITTIERNQSCRVVVMVRPQKDK